MKLSYLLIILLQVDQSIVMKSEDKWKFHGNYTASLEVVRNECLIVQRLELLHSNGNRNELIRNGIAMLERMGFISCSVVLSP